MNTQKMLTEIYTPTFKAVQRILIRRGLLLIAISPVKNRKKTKMEK